MSTWIQLIYYNFNSFHWYDMTITVSVWTNRLHTRNWTPNTFFKVEWFNKNARQLTTVILYQDPAWIYSHVIDMYEDRIAQYLCNSIRTHRCWPSEWQKGFTSNITRPFCQYTAINILRCQLVEMNLHFIVTQYACKRYA